MQEIFPGIYHITLTLKGFSPGSVNAYLLRDIRGFTIIDTGWGAPESLKSLETQLRQAGISFSEIKRVILTHLHLDHLGLMGKFKELNHASIYIHTNEIDLMKIRYSSGDTYWPMTDTFLQSHGVPESTLIPSEYHRDIPVFLAAPDVLLIGDEEISIGEYKLRVINTPGHTPGHISLYEPLIKFLISGDVLLPTIVTNAAPHVQQIRNPIQQYLNSLQTLRKLDINLILPGHEYVFSNPRKRIDEIVEHYRRKNEEVLAAIKSSGQPMTAYDIAQVIPYIMRTRIIKWEQLKGLGKRFAVLQTIALLEDLTESKYLSKYCQGNKTFYTR